MPTKARIYILDELRDAQEKCRKKPAKFGIQPDKNQIKGMMSKSNARKFVSNLLLSKEYGKESELPVTKNAPCGLTTNQDDSVQDEGQMQLSNERSVPQFQRGLSCGSMSVEEEIIVHEFSVDFADKLLSKHRVYKAACSVSGMTHHQVIDKVTKLLRNPSCTKEDVELTLQPDFMRVFNPSKLYLNLGTEFGMGKSLSVRLGRSRSVSVSLKSVIYQAKSKKIPKRNRRLMGMIVFVDPAADTRSIECTLKTRYQTKTRSVENTYSLSSDGNNYAYQITHSENVDRSYRERSVAANEQRVSRSLPGWNGRIPIFIPSQQVDFKLSRVKAAGGTIVSNHQNGGRGFDSLDSSAMMTSMTARGENTEAFPVSIMKPLDTDEPATNLLPSSPYQCLSAPCTPAGRGDNGPVDKDIKITFYAYPCMSLEEGLQRLSNFMQRMRNSEIATMTLPGKISAIHLASLHGNIEAVKKILDCGGDVNMTSGTLSYTPLHEAVMGGNVELIRFLLSRNADQRICDSNGWTPLHLACWNNDISCGRVLMRDEKAPQVLGKRDKNNKTPNQLCARRHMKDAIEACMKANGISVKKEQWWNSLSNSSMERTDGRKEKDKNALLEHIIQARMRGRPPQDSDYY